MAERGLENLRVYIMARELVGFVYKDLVPELPEDEKCGLVSQIKRAVISIPANIAEGYGRYYFQENIRYCYNARGSLEELFSHLIIAADLNYLLESEFARAINQIGDLRKAINGYIRYLKGRKEEYLEESGDQNIRESTYEEIYNLVNPSSSID